MGAGGGGVCTLTAAVYAVFRTTCGPTDAWEVSIYLQYLEGKVPKYRAHATQSTRCQDLALSTRLDSHELPRSPSSSPGFL